MGKAITTDPDVRGVIERDLAVCRDKQSHCDYLTDPWQRWETEIQILIRVLALFARPPEPSPSIDAAAKEIASRTDVDFLSLAGIRDILTRHFSTAAHPPAAEALAAKQRKEPDG